MKFLGLPTWLIVMLVRPYLDNSHPMKTPLTLEEYWSGQTDLCRLFDLLLWASLSGLVCLAILFRS